MPNAVNLRPYRDHSPHEVITQYAYSGSDVNKGTLVKIHNPWSASQANQDYNNPLGAVYQNTVSPRWSWPAQVVATSSTGDDALGIILNDVREFDENGEKLIFHPQLQYEREYVLSGEGLPICTRGVFMYSGLHGAVSPTSKLYVSGNGILTTVQNGANHVKVGKVVGTTDAFGWTPIKIEL